MTDTFDAADWLERAEAYGYDITLSPDVAGRLCLHTREPVGGRPEGPDPRYELTAAPGAKLPFGGTCWRLVVYGMCRGTPHRRLSFDR